MTSDFSGKVSFILSMDIQLLHNHLLRRLLSFPWTAFAFVPESVGHFVSLHFIGLCLWLLQCYSLFSFFMATPIACRSSQARESDRTWATVVTRTNPTVLGLQGAPTIPHSWLIWLYKKSWNLVDWFIPLFFSFQIIAIIVPMTFHKNAIKIFSIHVKDLVIFWWEFC